MTHVVRPDIRRSRVSLEGEAVIQGPDATWRVPLGDVSVTGLHLPLPPGFTLPVGQALEVELHCGPPQEGIDLLLLARVARTDATTLALRFAPMPVRLETAFEQILAHYGTLRGGTCEPAVGF